MIKEKNEKEYKHVYVYTHMCECASESLCYTPETKATLYVNYTSLKKNKKLNRFGKY